MYCDVIQHFLLFCRQPSAIPMFVNKTVVDLAVCVISKGATCHALQVVLPALKAAAAFIM
jgi:hypothetical protein